MAKITEQFVVGTALVLMLGIPVCFGHITEPCQDHVIGGERSENSTSDISHDHELLPCACWSLTSYWVQRHKVLLNSPELETFTSVGSNALIKTSNIQPFDMHCVSAIHLLPSSHLTVLESVRLLI